MTREEIINEIKPTNEMILERARQASKDLRKRFKEDLEQEPKTETWSIQDVADTLSRHGLIVEQEPVLDKIRAEIKEHADRLKDSLYGDGMRHCIDIIDKYKAESENKE